jgi:tripartite-type tricarboxylate transporter receptor subunit TctC
MRRRQVIKGTASVTAAALTAPLYLPAARAQAFPSKPINFIVPWPAGGSSDITLRAFAEAASKVLGQPLVIDNKAGASGTLGAAMLATTARPDGYTIAQLPITVFRLPLMQKVVWDPLKDFTYISHLSGYTFGITTKADGPFKTFKDVIDFAKANPGKVTYATPGAGTSLHIGTELIAEKAGVKLTQVPFKGGAETNAAVLGGHTMLQADSTGWKGLVDSGQLRLLCVWTSKRTKSWPDVPTLKDLGYDLAFESPYGVGGPKGMDPAVVKKIDEAFRVAAQDKNVIATHDKFDMPVTYMDPAAYDKEARRIFAQEAEALKKLGLAKKA